MFKMLRLKWERHGWHELNTVTNFEFETPKEKISLRTLDVEGRTVMETVTLIYEGRKSWRTLGV